jgi:hypothetical protein
VVSCVSPFEDENDCASIDVTCQLLLTTGAVAFVADDMPACFSQEDAKANKAEMPRQGKKFFIMFLLHVSYIEQPQQNLIAANIWLKLKKCF